MTNDELKSIATDVIEQYGQLSTIEDVEYVLDDRLDDDLTDAEWDTLLDLISNAEITVSWS